MFIIRLETDIELVGNHGLAASLFVLTGASTLQDVEQCRASNSIQHQKQIPDYYLPTLSDLADLLET